MTKKVQLFITCLIDTLYPQIGIDVVEVLQRAGVEVFCPTGQTCCGQPAFNAGLRQDAKTIAQHTIEIFEKTEGDVVIPSGSCCAMIRNHYAELFEEDPSWKIRAEKFAQRCYEFSEYLVDILNVSAVDSSYAGKITYHPSCHLLRELGVNTQPLKLLEMVKDADIVPLPNAEECCGFGGVFSIEHPQLSNAFLERKLKNVEASGADRVVTCDTGCMTNINGGFSHRHQPIKAVHLAQILNQHHPASE